MESCKHNEFDDLAAVTAIPIGNITATTATSPVNILTPTIAKADFGTPSLAGAVTIGVRPEATNGTLIPIMRDTATAKDTEADSVAGRLHTVSVNMEVDTRKGELWGAVAAPGNPPCSLYLERNAFHLLLTLRDGTQGFVAATEDTYQCDIERDGSKTTVAFRIQNMMGIQLIV